MIIKMANKMMNLKQ